MSTTAEILQLIADLLGGGSDTVTKAEHKPVLDAIANSLLNKETDSNLLGLLQHDPLRAYSLGEGVLKDGQLWQANQNIPIEAWNAAKWDQITGTVALSDYNIPEWDSNHLGGAGYSTGDQVTREDRLFQSDSDSNTSDPLVSDWTEISANDGTFGNIWTVGRYQENQVVTDLPNNKLYILAVPTPTAPFYNSQDFNAELLAGDWVEFNNHAKPTDAEIKIQYEANPDTNGFTDQEKVNLAANTAKVSFPEAPNDGQQYVRESEAWALNTGGAVPTLEEVLTAGQNTGVRNITFGEQTGIIWTEFGKPNAFMQTVQEVTDPRLRIQFDNMAFIQFQDAAYEKGYRFKAEDVKIYQGASDKSMNFVADTFNFIGNTGAFPSVMNFSLRPDANGFFFYFNFANGIRANNEAKGVSFKSGNEYINVIAGAGQTASYDVRFPIKPAGTKTFAFTEDIPLIPPPQDLTPFTKYLQQLNNLSIVLPLGLTIMGILLVPEAGDYIIEWNASIEHQNDSEIVFDMLETYDAGGTGTTGNNNMLFTSPQIGGGAGSLQNRPVSKTSVIRTFAANDTIDIRANVIDGTNTIRQFIAHLKRVG